MKANQTQSFLLRRGCFLPDSVGQTETKEDMSRFWSTSSICDLTFTQNQEELSLTPARFPAEPGSYSDLPSVLQHIVKADPNHKLEIPFRDEPDLSPRFGTVLFPHPGNVGGWRLRCTALPELGGRQRRDTKEMIISINKCSTRPISHGTIKTFQHF